MLRVVDSHTEGEPTRVVIEGGPCLGSGPLAARAKRLEAEHADFRNAVIGEPRGFDALVGALLCQPSDENCVTAVIFFNNVGLLGMCGHATIGTAVTLAHLGRIGLGRHRFETPAGIVTVKLTSPNQVSVENVESYRYLKDISVSPEGLGPVTGDVAWGGNWFYVTADAPCDLTRDNLSRLTAAGAGIRRALATTGITGAGGAEIDHIAFFGPSPTPGAHSRNFVLCPGGAYDRSPCGTGTSAKLACLNADGHLAPGETWTQESIIGSRYVASFRPGEAGRIVPHLTGRAYICAEATLYRDPGDPYAHGIHFQRGEWDAPDPRRPTEPLVVGSP